MLSFDGESRFDHLREVSQSLTVRLFSKQGSPRLPAPLNGDSGSEI